VGAITSEITSTACEASTQLRDLLVQVARGSRAAFARFYELTRRRICGVVVRCLRDFAQSQEVTQDIYLEIWQNASKFDAAKGTALAWAMTIAHRRAVDRVRSSQSDHNRDIAVGLRDRDVEFDSVSEAVEVSLEYQRVIRALSALSKIQREAVTLAYFDGLGHAEIGARLNVSVSTVKTRIRDALLKLRTELETNAAGIPA
jgi:RNA polymerase sigma-70 factor (ECF subfamily)